MNFRNALTGLLAVTFMAAAPVPAADPVGPILAKVRAHARAEGDRLWPGYGQAPFEFLLLETDREVLLCRNAPTPGQAFTPDGIDPATGCARQTRARSDLPAGLLAAMPLFGEPPTIVMGTPEGTGRTPAKWTRTIYHEHFHQFQYTRPGYYQRLAGLGLAGPKGGGGWILNYAFPYDDRAVGAAYRRAARALADAIEARGRANFLARFDAYLAARATWEATVAAKDWRYIEFQLWQEGVARWTEIMVSATDPDADVRDASAALMTATLLALRDPDLGRLRREIVYAQGAGEAMLMQACGDEWRKAYPVSLALGGLLRAARLRCRA